MEGADSLPRRKKNLVTTLKQKHSICFFFSAVCIRMKSVIMASCYVKRVKL